MVVLRSSIIIALEINVLLESGDIDKAGPVLAGRTGDDYSNDCRMAGIRRIGLFITRNETRRIRNVDWS
jgi:hypothetical protein